MKFIQILLVIIFLAFAQDVSAESEFSLGEALKKINKRDLPMSVEIRNTPEFIFRYKKVSLDYNHFDTDMHYLKINVDNELISMLGTGLNWNYGLTSIDWKADDNHNFVPVPTVGIGLHLTVLPKIKVYAQVSGMIMGGYGHLFDSESGLRYSPSKHLTWTAGYRHISENVRQNDNVGIFKMSEPFIGVRSDF